MSGLVVRQIGTGPNSDRRHDTLKPVPCSRRPDPRERLTPRPSSAILAQGLCFTKDSSNSGADDPRDKAASEY